jgi:hypothetical protein
VVRRAHRTVLARVFAFCLVAFTASPITAPFTTCDLTDFAQSHPADSGGHHPGRQMAVPHMRAAGHIVTMVLTPAPGLPVHMSDRRHALAPTTSFAYTRRDLTTVLRL